MIKFGYYTISRYSISVAAYHHLGSHSNITRVRMLMSYQASKCQLKLGWVWNLNGTQARLCWIIVILRWPTYSTGSLVQLFTIQVVCSTDFWSRANHGGKLWKWQQFGKRPTDTPPTGQPSAEYAQPCQAVRSHVFFWPWCDQTSVALSPCITAPVTPAAPAVAGSTSFRCYKHFLVISYPGFLFTVERVEQSKDCSKLETGQKSMNCLTDNALSSFTSNEKKHWWLLVVSQSDTCNIMQ